MASDTGLPRWACANCGFWQPYGGVPPSCPVCTDYRHPLPAEGWRFYTPAEVAAAHTTRWDEVLPGLWQFRTEPGWAISPRGYVLVRPEGNLGFEGATFYSDDALDHIASLGGVQRLSASHSHVFGGLWQLEERLRPETVIQQDELPWARAFRVAWPFEDRAELDADAVLVHTGRHTPGHSVLHVPSRRLLFCGDAFKFQLDAQGRAVGISTHRAYDAHIPLSHGDVRHYRDVLGALDFDAVATPWEVVPSGGKAAMLSLFERLLAGRPSADFFPI